MEPKEQWHIRTLLLIEFYPLVNTDGGQILLLVKMKSFPAVFLLQVGRCLPLPDHCWSKDAKRLFLPNKRLTSGFQMVATDTYKVCFTVGVCPDHNSWPPIRMLSVDAERDAKRRPRGDLSITLAMWKNSLGDASACWQLHTRAVYSCFPAKMVWPDGI